jgi:hypothetical protein
LSREADQPLEVGPAFLLVVRQRTEVTLTSGRIHNHFQFHSYHVSAFDSLVTEHSHRNLNGPQLTWLTIGMPPVPLLPVTNTEDGPGPPDRMLA